MINKIIKITIGQIIIWVLAWLTDIIQIFGNDFFQWVCIFIVPVCLLVKCILSWMSIHSCDKKDRLLKWILQYIIFLGIWWMETYVIVMEIARRLEANKWITSDRFFAGLYYGWWGMVAVTLVTVAVIMHILCTVIKRFSIHQVIYKIINTLFGILIVVTVYFGLNDYGYASTYFTYIILEALACFFFNWCYYKVE